MLGKTISNIVYLKVAPRIIETIVENLASLPSVLNLSIMTDPQTLYIQTFTDSNETFNQFVSAHLFLNTDILLVISVSLLRRVRHRRAVVFR